MQCVFVCVCTINLCSDASLCVRGQSLTQPHLLPGCVGDCVSEPAVSDLMDDVDQQELLTLQNGGDDEGQTRVLHRHDRERRREEYNIIPAE